MAAGATRQLMQEGDNVVIDLNGEKFSFVKLRARGTVMVAGAACPMQVLPGRELKCPACLLGTLGCEFRAQAAFIGHAAALGKREVARGSA